MNTSAKHLLSKYGLCLLLLVIVAFFALTTDTFFTPLNFGNIAVTQVATGILALGAMFITIVSEFDLSLGYNLMLCICVGGRVMELGLGSVAAVLAMLCTGALFGFLNGFMVVKLGVSAYIATLSSGLAMYGLGQAVTGGAFIRVALSDAWLTLATGKVGQLAYSVVFWLLLSVVVYGLLNHTVVGRHLFAVGDSPQAAFLAGVKSDLVKRLAFTLAGLFAAVAGILYLGQIGSASTMYGNSLLLPAYSMVFLSTAVIRPGTFNVPGLVIAIFFVGIGSNGMKIMGAPVWTSNVYEGAILIIALIISNHFRKSAGKRRLGKE